MGHLGAKRILERFSWKLDDVIKSAQADQVAVVPAQAAGTIRELRNRLGQEIHWLYTLKRQQSPLTIVPAEEVEKHNQRIQQASAAVKRAKEELNNALVRYKENAATKRILLIGEDEITSQLKEFLENYAMYGEYPMRFASVNILPSATEEEMRAYDLVITKGLDGYELLRRINNEFQTRPLGQWADLEALKQKIDAEIDLWLSM